MSLGTSKSKDLLQNLVRQAADRPVAEALQPAKHQAISALEKATGFPSNKVEAYKYTNFDRVLAQADTSLFQQAPAAEAPALPHLAETLRIGYAGGQWSLPTDLPKGLQLLSFAEAAASGLWTAQQEGADVFALLNTAHVENGLVLHVAKGAVLEHPVVLHVHTAAGLQQPRVHVVAEENSQSYFIEYHTFGGEAFVNAYVTGAVAANARLTWEKLMPERKSYLAVTNTHFTQERDSVLTTAAINFGGKQVRNNLFIDLLGEHTETHMNGLYHLQGDSHVDNQTTVDHREPNSESNELYKGVMDDKSTGVFNGKIYVQQKAQKTNAFQSNRNILLSPTATVNTKPQLEIWADDVKCSHGATTGQLDPDHLFYLRARGLDQKQAQALLLDAFAGEVINRLGHEGLQEYLRGLIHHAE